MRCTANVKMIVLHSLLLILLWGPSSAAAQPDGLSRLLPVWPISNVGDEIPQNLIQSWTAMGDKCSGMTGEFSSFPSKGNRPFKKGKKTPGLDCDDGDMTLFNGLLCAAGVEMGCRAVAEAQADSGRWYRSPNRRWLWANRCFSTADKLDAQTFRDNCANGFSPDMSLGVMLYVIHSKDVGRYRKWLNWLDANAATTKLCKKEGDRYVDCTNVDWPRVCTHDLGYDAPDDTPPFPIMGKVGGRCALRPPDAYDFMAVDDAMLTAPPARISAWEIESRVLTKAILQAAGGGALDAVPPLLVMSSFDAAHFPLHLDATRVLIRMIIRNPSLRLDNLPTLPNPDDLVNVMNVLTGSDATDPLQIKATAAVIASRARWNPFYQLLSDGPTPQVRSQIISTCPEAGAKPSKSDWIWEKDNRDKSYSMGWDCVFVGELFNKMRVKKDLVTELLDLFLQYADRLDASLKQLGQALQLAETANALAQKTLDEAERGLSDALAFIRTGYARARQDAVNNLNALNASAVQLNDQLANLQRQANSTAGQLAGLPDTIQEEFTENVCKWAPWPTSEICDVVKKVRNVVNPVKQQLRNALANLLNQRTALEQGAVKSVAGQIAAQTQAIADLDAKLQRVRADVENKVLENAVNSARSQLQLTGQALALARTKVAEARQAHNRAKAYISVWKKEG